MGIHFLGMPSHSWSIKSVLFKFTLGTVKIFFQKGVRKADTMDSNEDDLCFFSNSIIKIFAQFKFEEKSVTSLREFYQFVKFTEMLTSLYKIDHFENLHSKTRVFETGLTVK